MKHKKCDLFFLFIYTLLRSINVVHFARLFRSFCTTFPFILHDFPCLTARMLRRFLRALHPYWRRRVGPMPNQCPKAPERYKNGSPSYAMGDEGEPRAGAYPLLAATRSTIVAATV